MATRERRWPPVRFWAWLAALMVLLAGPVGAQGPAADAQQQLQSLNARVAEAYRAGDYATGVALAEEALTLARKAFGDRDERTLISLNNLASFYKVQGRYGEAEPLHQEALQAFRETLGPRHPSTLTCLNNLAALYDSQGRYGEAEPLYLEVLQTSREVLGPRHPHTLASLNNLAALYDSQGRYGEAAPLYQAALQAFRETLGPRHPHTLGSLNNLAALYEAQGRYGEAEPLYTEALQARREVLGPRHPSTLASLGNLAALYRAQGRMAEAEPLYREALQASREVLGARHPSTLASLGNLAALYRAQGRHAEAEPLFTVTLQGYREVLGPRHPSTLTSLGNLANLYRAQGRLGEAEPLYTEALQARREVLGPRHPHTLGTQLNMVWLLAAQDRRREAVRMLQAMEPNLLGRIGQELYATEAGAVRRHLVSSQATFQDVVLTLAMAEGSPEALRLAATTMLRWKGLQGEEEAYLARLARRSQDPRVQDLAGQVADLRTKVAAAGRGADPADFNRTLQALEAQQLALGQVSRDYKDHLRVQTANVDDVRAALPPATVLIEVRQYQPVDFRSAAWGEPRFAALLLTGADEPVLADLGSVAEAAALVAALAGDDRKQADAAAGALDEKLFAPFAGQLAKAKAVYLAADGVLHLVPYARLKAADGRYLEQRLALRLLASGRDLLRPDPDKPARGLLALGGIDFGAAATAAAAESAFAVAGRGDVAAALTRTAETFRDGFTPLPASGDEARLVRDWYKRLRKDEPAEAWSGADAGEGRLKALTTPPRVLHLATHGFFLPAPDGVPEPMLLSGVALAGANRVLAAKGEDGILFALEAQGLNLEGSELVVLSACDTAKGRLDYSEGVYGLVRALRTAGARTVLVTLWPVNDGQARDFMVAFYRTWLQQAGRSDPARALRDTRLAYIGHAEAALRDPRVWAPYVLIE